MFKKGKKSYFGGIGKKNRIKNKTRVLLPVQAFVYTFGLASCLIHFC